MKFIVQTNKILRPILSICIIAPWLIIIMVYVSNSFIDKSGLTLYVPFNTSMTSDYKKEITIKNILIEYSFEHFPRGIGVEARIMNAERKLFLTVGGDENTYIGLYDFNNDGELDVYSFSSSKWPISGVWINADDNYIYHKFYDNFKYRIIKIIAYFNIYFLLLLPVVFVLSILSLTFLLRINKLMRNSQ